MHEVDMTRCLVLTLQQWRQQHEPRTPRVDRVHLLVGDFTCVEPAALTFTWDAAVRGTWLHGSRLAIEAVPLVGRCVLCSCTYVPEVDRAYRSPCCDHPMEEIVSGRELKIRAIDYEFAPLTGPLPEAQESAAAAPLAADPLPSASLPTFLATI